MNEDSLASDSQPDNAANSGWAEITGRGIIPMASEEELEELQDMVDELLNSDVTDGQAGQGILYLLNPEGTFNASEVNELIKITH